MFLSIILSSGGNVATILGCQYRLGAHFLWYYGVYDPERAIDTP